MKDEEVPLEEVFLRDGLLYAKVLDELGGSEIIRLYPVGENEFIRKGGLVRIAFGEGTMTFDEETECKKLS